MALRDLTAGFLAALPNRIAFRTATTQLAQNYLAQPGAEALLGSGDLLVRTVGPVAVLRGQACRLKDDAGAPIEASGAGVRTPA